MDHVINNLFLLKKFPWTYEYKLLKRNATLDILWNFQDNAVGHLNMNAVSRHTQLWFNV